jgi:sugar (pentulose or hexulose) kinase
MHGVALVDGGGVARTPFVSWQDQRPLATVWPRVRAAVGDERFERWGRELKAGYPLVTLARWREEGLAIDGLTPASAPDVAAAALCGARPVQEASNASGMGGFDLDAGGWDRAALASLGFDEVAWADVVPHGTVVGTYRGVPVHVAVGDQQAALAGVFLAEGELSLNVATGSQASRIAAAGERGEGQRRPYFGRVLRTVTHIPAGRSLNVLAALVSELGGPDDPWPEILRRAEAAPATELDVDLSFFAGAFGERGRIDGITEALDVGTLFRAAFAGMAGHYARAAELIGAQDAQRVVFSGGLGRRTSLLREAVADRLPLPQRTTHHDEDALAGLLATTNGGDLAAATATVRAADDAGELIA